MASNFTSQASIELNPYRNTVKDEYTPSTSQPKPNLSNYPLSIQVKT
jgi:hypothetical protein